MTDNRLKTVPIDELKPGMFVSEILEQSGSVKIKSRGKVTSKTTIENLKKRGVLSVVIDISKAFNVTEGNEKVNESSTFNDNSPEVKRKNCSFEREIENANTLYQQGKAIQQDLLSAVQGGLPFDEQIPKEFTEKLVESIERNPNALLCISKIREKDDYLLEHSLNVSILLANFACYLELPQEHIEDLAFCGFIHDLGKIRVPDEILHKPGKLTDEEMSVMRQHVTFGVDVLSEMSISPHLLTTVSEHHERLDGHGYPLALNKDKITTWGRMLAIADVYDALTADRCYKPGMASQKAFQIILADTPHKLDELLVQRFIKCMGVYPVGSLVKLSNERVAVVLSHKTSPLKPVVKVFYSLRGKHYIEPKDIDLANEDKISIEKAVKASDYNLDFNQFFRQAILR